MDTFAVRLAVPLIGPAKVFHLLGLRPAGRTKKKSHAGFTGAGLGQYLGFRTLDDQPV
jgi:hypothetical protein